MSLKQISLLTILPITFLAITIFKSQLPTILGSNTDLTPATIISLTNLARQENHLSPLTPNDALNQAAQQKAEHMISQNYFAHQYQEHNPVWNYLSQAGFIYSHAGENLARNYTDSQTLVNAWLKSPSHRNNLLSPDFTHIGVAVIYDQENPVVVQVLATPAPVLDHPSHSTAAPLVYRSPAIYLLSLILLLLLPPVFYLLNRPKSHPRSSRTPALHLWHR